MFIPWCVERCVPDLKKNLASATHYRSKFAVSVEEFQQSVGENDIAFTHCSDIGQVFALQAKVYRQKLLGTRTLMLHFPSREDRQKNQASFLRALCRYVQPALGNMGASLVKCSSDEAYKFSWQ